MPRDTKTLQSILDGQKKIHEELKSVDAKVDANGEMLGSLEKDVKQVGGRVDANGERIGSLEESVNGVKEDVKSVKEDLKKGIKKVEGKVDANGERLDKIGSQLAYLEDDAPTREEHDELEKRVDKVEHKTASV